MFQVSRISFVALLIWVNCCPISSLDLVPLYRLYRDVDKYHLLVNEADGIYSVNHNQFAWNGVIGWVVENPQDSVNELRSIYRLYKPAPRPQNDHLFTYSESEANLAVNTIGYTRNGIPFYCAVNENDFNATIPLHRFWMGSIRHHMYTTNYTEGNEIVAAGGGAAYEGVLCYIWK